MDLTFEQRALKTTARDLLEKECPKRLLRDLAREPVALPAALYAQMAELGWFGLIVPASYGGSEGSFFDMVVLLEEMGRACLPGPFFDTAVSSVLTLLWAGTEEQKREYLPPIAAGETYITVASRDLAAANEAPAESRVSAVPTSDGFLLNGRRLFAPDANLVAHAIVVAVMTPAPNAAAPLGLFLTDLRSPGVTVTPRPTLTADRLCEIVLDNVHVPGGAPPRCVKRSPARHRAPS